MRSWEPSETPEKMSRPYPRCTVNSRPCALTSISRMLLILLTPISWTALCSPGSVLACESLGVLNWIVITLYSMAESLGDACPFCLFSPLENRIRHSIVSVQCCSDSHCCCESHSSPPLNSTLSVILSRLVPIWQTTRQVVWDVSIRTTRMRRPVLIHFRDSDCPVSNLDCP
jgi:hypothetical protein